MNHIEQTIVQLTAARDRAEELISGLREFQAGLGGAELAVLPIAAPLARAATPAPTPSTPTRLEDIRRKSADRPTQPKGRVPVPVKSNTSLAAEGTGGTSLRDPRLIAEVRKLAEPINAQVLVANAVVREMKAAQNVLNRMLQRGWLEKVGRGQFERTRAYGGEGASSGPNATLAEIHAEMAKGKEAEE